MSAVSLSKNPVLIDIIFGKPFVTMKLDELSKSIKNSSQFEDIWFDIIKEDAKSVKRSWTNIKEDKSYDNAFMERIIFSKQPEPISQYSINKFGLVLNNIAPILYDGDLVGAFNFITHFTFLNENLERFNFRSAIFLDKENSKKIDVKHSMSKSYIGDSYVVNKNANKTSMKVIFNRGLDYYINFEGKYIIDEHTNSFETIHKLKDMNDKTIGYIVLMTPLDELDMGELYINQEAHIYFTIFIIFSLAMMTYFTNSYSYISSIKEENEVLTIQNMSVQEKNDELDFNEKKIANMFHMQPNFMVLSDGIGIENVNERMIWLLNAPLENAVKDIKAKYKCISEVFEESEDKELDLSDYIFGDSIKGIAWKDYILENFKRNYKTCIRDPFGKQHHFSIKINEMKYANLSKRFIIISFIDITADIYAHVKKEEEMQVIMTNSKREQINSIYDEVNKPLSAITLTATNMKFKNSTENLEEQDIDGFADKVISDVEIVKNTLKTFIEKKDS